MIANIMAKPGIWEKSLSKISMKPARTTNFSFKYKWSEFLSVDI